MTFHIHREPFGLTLDIRKEPGDFSLQVGPFEVFIKREEGAGYCRIGQRRSGEIVFDIPFLSVAFTDRRKFTC
ncbi:hypothetical protein R3X27_15490 [Tropicimonas sp. TH_r6]|uniref:hypothetical protein n=1 Tax=Tropicimonas sp. TH_r6 TaxID=3082085 RepID=UPI002953CA03|nr:hypothetical protein [Tropicimonas sp. TH_r6]MDV7144091.1 hypothetical protein [Tropicimonas sp. TH_r6]